MQQVRGDIYYQNFLFVVDLKYAGKVSKLFEGKLPITKRGNVDPELSSYQLFAVAAV
jgi:hypothetical protein